MTETKGEITRIQVLKKQGAGRADTFLLSPPLSEREIDAITPGHNDGGFSDDKIRRLKKLEDSGLMARVSIISGEVEVDGTKGSLMVVDSQGTDEALAEDIAVLGSTVCILRDEPRLDLRLVHD